MERDETMPLIQQVREITFATPDDEGMLNFVPAALALGCTAAEADRIDSELTARIMRSRGGI